MTTPNRFALEIPLKLLMLMVCIQQLHATKVDCWVTETEAGYLYSVPEFEGDKCVIKWFITADYDLAYISEDNEKHYDPKGPVLSVTNRTLQMNLFQTPVHYSRTCLSDGIETTATCTSDTTGIRSRKVDEGGNTVTRPPKVDEGTTPWLWGKWVLVAVGVLALLALLGVFVFKKRRSRSHTPVNTDDAEGAIPMS